MRASTRVLDASLTSVGGSLSVFVDRADLRASRKAFAMEEWRMIRSVDMQIWPDCFRFVSKQRVLRCREDPTFKKAPANTSRTATCRSASAQTIALFFPPSSIKQGLRFSPQVRAIFLPVAVLPVKLILRTSGCSIIAVTTSAASCGRQEMIFRQPGGRPASWNARPMAQ